jgi:acyl dehydratase
VSTENPFQVGDTVRVLPTEADPKSGLNANEHRTVEHADATHVRVEGSPYEWFARRFELVKRADTTPAPLDPTAVKAGDTVTVHVECEKCPDYDVSGEVYHYAQSLASAPVTV